MASEEDRLEALLNAARKQLGEPVEEEQDTKGSEEKADRAEAMPSFKDIARDIEDSDPNAKMSDDDIAALFAAMGNDGDDAGSGEADTVPETETAAPSEAEPAAGSDIVSDDPNAKMSDDDIAALFAAMGDDSEGSGSGEAVPEPEPEPAATSEAEPAEEKVSEDSISQPMEDGSSKNMSQSEIEAMLAENGGEDIIFGSGDEIPVPDGPGLEDIEAQLAAAEAAGLEDDGTRIDSDAEFDQIMANLGEDDIDLSDIGNMIEKSDSGELVDPSIAEDKGEAAPDLNGEEQEEEGDGDGKKKKKRVKKKREKKTKEPKEGAEAAEKKEKKPGFFSKLVAALFTEEEDPEEVLIPEADATKLSDENAAILGEIEAEKEKGKPKKEKKKKEKKPKEEKPKKEKKPRPKKEKKPEEPDNSKRIPKKYIARTVLLAASIMIALLLVGTILPGLMNMRDARKAYYEKDYKTAFLTMYGKDLNESDKKLYQRSRLLVMLDRKYESYEHYMNMGMEKEALDALFQGLARYDDLLPQIQSLGVDQEALAIRLKFTDALASVFGVSELEAMETLKYSEADYTGKVDAVIEGRPYRPMQEEIFEEYGIMLKEQENEQPQEPEGDDELPDLLPEEKEYLEGRPEEDEPVELPAESPSQVLFFQDGNVDIQIESDQF
ncbi:MAG: hypothetical protein IKR23_12355 [Lachnospiraceae bacterium]|nr:hypothetical protein [Lachnospiraceae bacterium]